MGREVVPVLSLFLLVCLGLLTLVGRPRHRIRILDESVSRFALFGKKSLK